MIKDNPDLKAVDYSWAKRGLRAEDFVQDLQNSLSGLVDSVQLNLAVALTREWGKYDPQ